MLNTKTIPLVFSYSGTPAENYTVLDVDWKPEMIEVAGNSEVLAALTALRIPEEVVNVDGIDQELQLIIDITEYLPSGVILKDEANASILVIVEVEYQEPAEEGNTEEENTSQTEKPSGDTADDNAQDTEDTGENTGDSAGEQNGTDDSTNDSNAGDNTSTETDGEGNQNSQEKENEKNESTKNNS